MTQSRREFLASIAAAGVGALLPTSIRIDIHHHIVPPSLLQALGPQRLAGASASWTPAKGLEALDQGGVSTGMTSIAPAGDPFNDPSTAACARWNTPSIRSRRAGSVGYRVTPTIVALEPRSIRCWVDAAGAPPT